MNKSQALMEHERRKALVQTVVDVSQWLSNHYKVSFGSNSVLMARNSDKKVKIQLGFSSPVQATSEIGNIEIYTTYQQNVLPFVSIRVNSAWRVYDTTSFDTEGELIEGKIRCEPQDIKQLQIILGLLQATPPEEWRKYLATDRALVSPKDKKR